MRESLEAALVGAFDAPMVFTRLFLALGNTAEIASLLSRAESERRLAGDRDGADRLHSIAALAARDPAAFDKMRDILAILHGESAPAATASVAAAFDSAVELSPAASVALYSLGDPSLLARATGEIVAFLRERGLIIPRARVLEIGCGIDRFAEALAPEVASFTGIDVSKNMIGLARERCAELPNVTFAQTSGGDLSACSDTSFDVVLGVDSFPYIVAARPGLAELHIQESARVLSDKGSLAIFNFAYGEDFGASRERLQRAGEPAGLMLIAADANPLRSWDGSFFHLRKQRSK
ncbi:MAG: class I SAM-dependent methyltransferase [Methylobacteriaceae bacterium]|nr:class I SAM-dependent methyltransferase [Methylobacteriaceae bacterium]